MFHKTVHIWVYVGGWVPVGLEKKNSLRKEGTAKTVWDPLI